MKLRKANKVSKKKHKGFLKTLVLLIFLVVGIVGIRHILFPQKIIAIVHNQENTSQISYPFIGKNIGFIDVYTKQTDLDSIKYIIKNADGVVFAGGTDFDPSIYGGDSSLVEEYSRYDDDISLEALRSAIEMNKPILGICRGMQLINLYYGGTLYDDIPTQYSKDIVHRGNNNTYAYHNVNILDNTYLSNLFGANEIEVNSYHHEGIKDLAEGLRVSAQSPDGLVEAIENPYYSYMVGVQWHPEGSYPDNEYSRIIFDDFIRKLK